MYIFGVWDGGFANSFWDHAIQMNFQYIFPTMKKLKSVVETSTPYNQILIFEDSYVCPIWIFIFDTDQAQINNELPFYCSHIFSSFGMSIMHNVKTGRDN
jgi:hypothetical protein